jgi:hypothetical protein
MLSGNYPAAFFINQDMQLSIFENTVKPQIELWELFEAYFSCRKNKRNTANALAFEVDYESKLVKLCEEINEGTYEISRSIAFIVNKPVQREIFAADFRDRIVHHLIIGKLNHLFEQQFIYDSYACTDVSAGTGRVKALTWVFEEWIALSAGVHRTTVKIAMC